ncbi:hypothetical protein [Hymenobacter sp. UYCo722]|uniref:hypothetical protein n=1 Tax=Hymenobacter sp. UYCo722 TaxID=3156335 RepID=UPI003391DE02
MPNLIKFLLASLLLVLAIAVGTEVAALHRKTRPAGRPLAAPVVVRKSAVVPLLRKTVHAVAHRAG